MIRLFITSALLTVLLFGGQAQAQDNEPTQRERELERQIQQLLTRMNELEQRLEAQEQKQAPPSAQRQPVGIAQQQPAEAPPSGDLEDRVAKIESRLFKFPNPMDIYWKDGIRFETADGNFKFKLGGRIQLDGAIMNADNDLERGGFGPFRRGVGDLEDAVEFRRARLYLSGTIYEDAFFKVQYDFADGDADFRDVYAGLKNLPWVGTVRIGHFKEPFSLEQLTSSKYITFMERSVGTESNEVSRNTGIMLNNTAFNDRLTWQVGAFIRTDSFGDGEFDDGFNYTGRLTGLAWYEDDRAKLLHLGAALSHRNYEGDRLDHAVRLRERPEAHLAPRFIDTGVFNAESATLFGLEAAWVHGPLSVQSEYIRASFDGVGDVWGHTPNPDFQSFYIMTSYFLTGEHRKYDKRMGVFGRVRPHKNFREDGGWGAWEVAARYSHVDLDDDGISGGELDDFTFGLNWYLNPNMRMMFNYIYSDVEDSGNANIFMVRWQVDF